MRMRWIVLAATAPFTAAAAPGAVLRQGGYYTEEQGRDDGIDEGGSEVEPAADMLVCSRSDAMPEHALRGKSKIKAAFDRLR